MKQKKQKGQVIIILLLIILVSLSIGLVVVQNSLTDVSTSTKTEYSSRAFSAAEAGLERALLLTGDVANLDLGNDANADVVARLDLPQGPEALEYPPITRADFAHFWFENPTGGGQSYNEDGFMVYFGNCSKLKCSSDFESDLKPAVEVNTVLEIPSDSQLYRWDKRNFDSVDRGNGFVKLESTGDSMCSDGGVLSETGGTTASANSKFYCMVKISGFKDLYGNDAKLKLARIRVLYSNSAQKVAVGPLPATSNLPPQASIYTATGTSGESVRRLEVFREKNVVPYFFDFAVFSTENIDK